MDEKEDIAEQLAARIAQSIGQEGDSISEARVELFRRYHALPYGTEQEGRSKVLTSECRDTALWLLPSLLKVFLASDKVVEFVPRSAAAEGMAEQQTDVVNYMALERNDGYGVLYQTLLDALMMGSGYVRWYAERRRETRREAYTGLTEAEAAGLEASGVRIESIRQTAEGLLDASVVREAEEMEYKIESLPPERVLVDRDAVDVETSRFIGIIHYKTRGELAGMGIDPGVADDLPAYGSPDTGVMSMERALYDHDDAAGIASAADMVEIVECWARLEDGRLHHAIVNGRETCRVLFDEEAEEIPVAYFTPFPNPHAFFGDSLVQYVAEIQRMSTGLWRQAIDYFNLVNAPMRMVDISQVNNKEDLLRNVPGGFIRVKNLNAVAALPTPPLSPEIFGMFDRLKRMKDMRTGVMEVDQGLNPNAINKTATGVVETMEAGRQIQDMIARNFAEIGMKRLFKGVYGLLARHQDVPLTLRLRGRWVEVNPADWDEQCEVRVSVGLGSGSQARKMADLEAILAKQLQLMPLGLATPKQIYSTLTQQLIAAGYKNADSFWINPDAAPPAPPAPPPPDPAQIELQKAQLQAETKRYDVDKRFEADMAELELKRDVLNLKAQGQIQSSLGYDLIPGVQD